MFNEDNILRNPFRVNFCHWPVASPYFSLFYHFVSVSLFVKWLQYVVAINKLLWDLTEGNLCVLATYSVLVIKSTPRNLSIILFTGHQHEREKRY